MQKAILFLFCSDWTRQFILTTLLQSNAPNQLNATKTVGYATLHHVFRLQYIKGASLILLKVINHS